MERRSFLGGLLGVVTLGRLGRPKSRPPPLKQIYGTMPISKDLMARVQPNRDAFVRWAEGEYPRIAAAMLQRRY